MRHQKSPRVPTKGRPCGESKLGAAVGGQLGRDPKTLEIHSARVAKLMSVEVSLPGGKTVQHCEHMSVVADYWQGANEVDVDVEEAA